MKSRRPRGEALGMIETHRLVAMIEAADAMVKAATSTSWAGRRSAQAM
jgi:hypothetical protein